MQTQLHIQLLNDEESVLLPHHQVNSDQIRVLDALQQSRHLLLEADMPLLGRVQLPQVDRLERVASTIDIRVRAYHLHLAERALADLVQDHVAIGDLARIRVRVQGEDSQILEIVDGVLTRLRNSYYVPSAQRLRAHRTHTPIVHVLSALRLRALRSHSFTVNERPVRAEVAEHRTLET